MKTVLIVLVGIILLVGLVHLLQAVVGLLFGLAIALGVLACIVGLLRSWFRARQERAEPDHRAHRRTAKAAERALIELERKVNKQDSV